MIYNMDGVLDRMWMEYTRNGYKERWNRADEISNTYGLGMLGSLGEVGLINTEVSEALEEIRSKTFDKDKLGMECADILIRTLNFMMRLNIDIDHAFTMAFEKNEKRGYLHGKGI